MDAIPYLFATACFWGSLAAVLYAYAVYPLLIRVVSRGFGRYPRPPAGQADADLPTLSLLVAAHNEESVIEDRIRNALALDYPAGRLEVVIACDGCTDATVRLARRYEGRGVRVLDFPERRGKAATLNDCFPLIRGEVVILSDANTLTDRRAARNLVRWFQDPRIGVVCGRLVLTDPASGRNVDGLYWKYETWIKRAEGALGALLGANGGIYAIRRRLLAPVPETTIIDDFVLPLQGRLDSAYALVFDREAVAHEESAPDFRAEFRRRSRIGAGGFQSLVLLAGLLDPRRGWVAFSFFSHKVLRWLCPFFLLVMLASCGVLGTWEFNPGPTVAVYRTGLVAQASFYLVALAAVWLPGQSRPARLLRLPTMFTSMNAALLVGFWRWVWGSQKAAWQRTARLAQAAGTPFEELMPEEAAGVRPVAAPQEA